jgi:hypothetical protein
MIDPLAAGSGQCPTPQVFPNLRHIAVQCSALPLSRVPFSRPVATAAPGSGRSHITRGGNSHTTDLLSFLASQLASLQHLRSLQLLDFPVAGPLLRQPLGKAAGAAHTFAGVAGVAGGFMTDQRALPLSTETLQGRKAVNAGLWALAALQELELHFSW